METKMIRMQEVDSTNTFLKNLKTYDADALTVAVADHQTAGRGQGTHTWESEPGKNLLFSLLTCPTWVPVRQQFLLSEAGALAVKDALDTYTDGITLKWPNDVYWNDKKISGTLIETSIDSKGIKRCIFGIGININQMEFRSDAPNPVSLAQILGHEVDREEVLQKIIEAFKKYYLIVHQCQKFQEEIEQIKTSQNIINYQYLKSMIK